MSSLLASKVGVVVGTFGFCSSPCFVPSSLISRTGARGSLSSRKPTNVRWCKWVPFAHPTKSNCPTTSGSPSAILHLLRSKALRPDGCASFVQLVFGLSRTFPDILRYCICAPRKRAMQKTGKVTFSNGEASLEDGTRLAICDDSSPFVAAGTFLRNVGIKSGKTITVTGEDGQIEGVSVFCMTDATPAANLAAAPRKKATAKKAGAKKVSSKPRKRN